MRPRKNDKRKLGYVVGKYTSNNKDRKKYLSKTWIKCLQRPDMCANVADKYGTFSQAHVFDSIAGIMGYRPVGCGVFEVRKNLTGHWCITRALPI